MPIVEMLTKKSFTKLLSSHKKVFVDFHAKWCPPCKTIMPEVENLAEKFSKIKFVKIDVDEAEELAYDHQISKMPTFIVFENGIEIDRFTGAQKEPLERMLTNLDQTDTEPATQAN